MRIYIYEVLFPFRNLSTIFFFGAAVSQQVSSLCNVFDLPSCAFS